MTRTKIDYYLSRESKVLIARLNQIYQSEDPYYTNDHKKVGGVVESKKVTIEWVPNSFTLNDLGSKGTFFVSVDGVQSGSLSASNISEVDLLEVKTIWFKIKTRQVEEDAVRSNDLTAWFWNLKYT